MLAVSSTASPMPGCALPTVKAAGTASDRRRRGPVVSSTVICRRSAVAAATSRWPSRRRDAIAGEGAHLERVRTGLDQERADVALCVEREVGRDAAGCAVSVTRVTSSMRVERVGAHGDLTHSILGGARARAEAPTIAIAAELSALLDVHGDDV